MTMFHTKNSTETLPPTSSCIFSIQKVFKLSGFHFLTSLLSMGPCRVTEQQWINLKNITVTEKKTQVENTYTN